MKLFTRISIFLMLLFGLGGATAFAQFSSGIEGIVHDTTGAVIAKAKVTVTNTRLGVSNTVLSGDNGYFRFDGLPASIFDIQIQAPGFETWKQNGLALQIAEIHTITPELKVGAISTNVEVSATAAQVDLETPATGAEISSETVTNTPLTGQNVYSLASFTPGMTGGGVVTAGQDNYTNEYAINLNAAGLRQEQNGYPNRRRLHQYALTRRRHIDLSRTRDRAVRRRPRKQLRRPEGKERRRHHRHLHQVGFQPVSTGPPTTISRTTISLRGPIFRELDSDLQPQ